MSGPFVVDAPYDPLPEPIHVAVRRAVGLAGARPMTPVTALRSRVPALARAVTLEVDPRFLPVPPPEVAARLTASALAAELVAGATPAVNARLVRLLADAPAGSVPVVVGVDHALTAGAYEALRGRGKPPLLLVLDAHFDGFTLAEARALRMAVGTPAPPWEAPDHPYGCHRFLLDLWETGLLDPTDLLVVGVRWLPRPAFVERHHDAARPWLERWAAWREAGATIVGAAELVADPEGVVARLRDHWHGRSLYLSVDLDVLAGPEVPSVRFPYDWGLAWGHLEPLLAALRRDLEIGATCLVGVDLMELDVTTLAVGVEGHVNRTLERAAGVLAPLLV